MWANGWPARRDYTNFTVVNNFDVAKVAGASFIYTPRFIIFHENGRTTFRLLALLTFHFCRISCPILLVRCVL